MYESHFGFHRQPFQCAELTRAFFVSQSIRNILPQVLHALRSDLGVAVLTGPVGCGKTSLLRHLQTLLANDGRALVCSGAILASPLNLLQTLHSTLQGRSAQRAVVDPATQDVSQSRWTLLEQLKRTSELWGPVVLLIDDAQLLPVSVLNELRAFTEEEWNGRSLVRCLIAGPLNLEEELARPSHADFSHRIRCHAFLEPLTTRESLELLSRHIEAVGGHLSRVFSPDALELISGACDGLPRCLSLLADEALVIAADRMRPVADADCVRSALSRLQHLPYPWSMSPLSTDDEEEAYSSEPTESEPLSKSVSASTSFVDEHFASGEPSRGVIEFGAPQTSHAIVEIGGSSSRGDSMPSELFVEKDYSAQPIKPAVVKSIGNFTSFEVGQRFVQDAVEVVETMPEVESLDISRHSADLCDADMPGFNAGYAVSWENLEGYFEVTEFRHLSSQDGTPASSAFANGYDATLPDDHRVDVTDADQTSSDGSVFSERWLSATAGGSFAKRLPVFDRYTWVELGREVPSGSYSVRSSSVASRAAYDEAVARTSERPPRAGQSFDVIGVFNLTEEEFDLRMSSASLSSEIGDFIVGRINELSSSEGLSQEHTESDDIAALLPVGVESFNPPELFVSPPDALMGFPEEPVHSDENRRAIRDAILSRLSAVDSFRDQTDIESLVDTAISHFRPVDVSDLSAGSHWHDGQLVFGGTIAGINRIDSEVAPAVDDANHLGHKVSGAIGNAESNGPAKESTFFTLPKNIKVVTWDLRPESIGHDDFLPLAESLTALQNEVTSFQQGARRDSESVPSADVDDLISDGRRRGEDPSQRGDAPLSPLVEFAGALKPAKTSDLECLQNRAGSENNTDVKRMTSFGQLFTRLRQLRSASREI